MSKNDKKPISLTLVKIVIEKDNEAKEDSEFNNYIKFAEETLKLVEETFEVVK